MTKGKWVRNNRGNEVLVSLAGCTKIKGVLATVFHHDNRGDYGYKFVCDGDFSDCYDTVTDAKEAAESHLLEQ
jgi:hypothetical protein